MSWVLQAGKVAYDASDFDNDAARQEKATSGEELIRLTNWVSGNTSRPLIQAGSKIVVNNTLFYTDSDTALIDDPAGLVDGEVFIRFEKSGTDPAFTLIAYLTNDDPRTAATFDAAKGGWYEPATNNKYIDIIMEVSGTLTSFDLKGIIDIDSSIKRYIDGSRNTLDVEDLGFKGWIYLQGAGGITQNITFDKLKVFMPNIGDKIAIQGIAGTLNPVMYMEKTSATVITFYDDIGSTETVTDGVGTFKQVGLVFNPANSLDVLL